MNPRTATVLGVLALATLITYEELASAPEKTEAEAKTDGARLEHNVYAVKSDDGGARLYVSPLSDGGFVKLDKSPCARRPAGVSPMLCLALLPDGGTRDQGDENTMQPGTFVGVGCVRTACVIFAGEQPETGP